jgi:serine/threonine protein kinase
LKLENVMMTDDSEGSIPKLVDFGLAAIVSPDKRVKDAVGTVSYAAPEILQGQRYDKAVDVWSLGIIYYVLLAGYLPFDAESKKEIVERTLHEETPMDDDKWTPVSASAKNLVKEMLNKNKKKRCSMEDVLNSNWLVANKEIKQQRLSSSDGRRKSMFESLTISGLGQKNKEESKG